MNIAELPVIGPIFTEVSTFFASFEGMSVVDIVNCLIGFIPGEIKFLNVLIPVALIAVSLVFALMGRKLLNVLKFLVCAGAGYYLGAKLLFPLIAGFVGGFGVTDVIVGVVLAVVCALLGKVAYAVVFAGIFGFASLMLLPTYVVALQNPVYSIAAAVAVTVFVLLFRGFVETLSTSVLGGLGFATGLYTTFVAVTALLGLGDHGTGLYPVDPKWIIGSLSAETILILAVATIVALIGFVKQTKSRHRF